MMIVRVSCVVCCGLWVVCCVFLCVLGVAVLFGRVSFFSRCCGDPQDPIQFCRPLVDPLRDARAAAHPAGARAGPQDILSRYSN
jgi:hypothetical protein